MTTVSYVGSFYAPSSHAFSSPFYDGDDVFYAFYGDDAVDDWRRCWMQSTRRVSAHRRNRLLAYA